jgi:hypothetical protein
MAGLWECPWCHYRFEDRRALDGHECHDAP